MSGRLVPAVAAALLAMAPALEAQETHRLSGPEVAIYNLAGRVELVRGTGSDVVVRLTRGGRDGDRLRVEAGALRGRTALRVVYPDDEIIYPEMGRGSNTTQRVRGDGTFSDGYRRGGERVRIRGSDRGLEAWADLVVEVPAGRELSVYLAVGESEARGLDGEILIDTGSGSVRFSDVDGDEVAVDTGSGSIDLDQVASPDIYLDTGSGSVDLNLLEDVESLDVDTGSGSVRANAPSSLGARIEVETGSGGIDVEFPVEVRTVRRDRLVGTIGDGRGRIRIDTGSGGVRLTRN